MVARKKTTKKIAKRKAKAFSSKSPASLKWDFPARELHILSIELLALSVFAVFIFWYMYGQFERQFFGGALSAILFVSLYFVVSSIIKRIHYVEEKYHLSKSDLKIMRYRNGKQVASIKVTLSDVVMHKFDHFFLGAYLLTDFGKHVLFFNNEAESRSVHEHLKRHIKKR